MDEQPNAESRPDPRFLGGEKAVLTNVADMALVIAIGWDGACDISSKISKTDAARHLRYIADQWDPPVQLDVPEGAA